MTFWIPLLLVWLQVALACDNDRQVDDPLITETLLRFYRDFVTAMSRSPSLEAERIVAAYAGRRTGCCPAVSGRDKSADRWLGR